MGQGYAAVGWNRVADVFRRHVETGQQKGGGFAVFHNGELVFEFVGGYADSDAGVAWETSTLMCLFSATKAFGAVVIAMLVDRVLMDYSDPVVKHWPEFEQNQKRLVTVDQLLSHQAGLILLEETFSLFDITANPESLSNLLASAKPQWAPGSDFGFHTMTLGLYMDELVRRVDPHHRRLDQFFREEISQQFGIDSFIGLPKEETFRSARVEPLSFASLFDLLLSPKYWNLELASRLQKDSNIAKIFSNYVEGRQCLENNPSFREIPCASWLGFSTVRGLAQFYGILANSGRHGNLTLLSPSTIKRLNMPLVHGIDNVYFLNLTLGRGTVIKESKTGDNIFGHFGYGGQAGFADPEHRLGWAYLTNHPSIYHDADDWKYLELVDAMYSTVLEMEAVDRPRMS